MERISGFESVFQMEPKSWIRMDYSNGTQFLVRVGISDGTEFLVRIDYLNGTHFLVRVGISDGTEILVRINYLIESINQMELKSWLGSII